MRQFWIDIKDRSWFKFISNKFTIATLVFAVWMMFLDVNSWSIHRQLDQEIEDLEESIQYYQEEIAKDQKLLNELGSDPEKLEKFAREHYYLRKPNEELYLIEVDEAPPLQ